METIIAIGATIISAVFIIQFTLITNNYSKIKSIITNLSDLEHEINILNKKIGIGTNLIIRIPSRGEVLPNI